jgi:hypothetical protein
MKELKPKPPQRPSTFGVKLDATPEEIARRIFANAKPPDPTKNKHKPGNV